MLGGLSRFQWQVLGAIRDLNDTSINSVTAALGARISSVSRARSLLKKDGLIVPWNNYDDQMQLTPFAKTLVAPPDLSPPIGLTQPEDSKNG